MEVSIDLSFLTFYKLVPDVSKLFYLCEIFGKKTFLKNQQWNFQLQRHKLIFHVD